MSDHSETGFLTFAEKNSIQTCLINLAQCDIVIVILSQRYGPSLVGAGFSDHSATHLEYIEALKLKMKTIVFVRDRLEADFSSFKKTNDVKVLQWIKEKDLKLFDIIEEHKKLVNTDKINWYWTFRNSVDIKERLRIDLKNEIDTTRLNKLIDSGNCALLTATTNGNAVSGSTLVNLNFLISNLGNQSAIEPIVVIFKAD